MARFVFVLLCAFAFSVSTFGQDMDTDLKKSFNKFTVVKINDQEALQKAKLRIPFQIRIPERNFQFILRLNDIRSDDYRSEYTDNNGRHTLPKEEVTTYKSTLIGERNSVVAFTVNGKKTEGYLATESEDFYLEPAKKYSSHAKDEDKVIYKVKDKVQKDDGICGLDEAVGARMEKINSSVNFNTALNSTTGRRVLEVATEADKEFVQDQLAGNGNPATANAHILSVLNQVDVVFEAQLNLSIVITFQHAWMPNTPDPYAGLINLQLVQAFRDRWNAVYPLTDPQNHRDLAHLFSGKITFDETGRAYDLGVICNKPQNAYSISETMRFDKWLVVAHEFGHLLNAFHTDQYPFPAGCDVSIMKGGQYPATSQFCPYSLDQINTHINTYGDCLHFEHTDGAKTLFDFDADGEADLSVFRPSNIYWYIQRSTAGFITTPFGQATDKLAPADYDGDGKTDIAVYRNGDWWLERSSAGSLYQPFGLSGDIPVPADFTGDGKAELVVFRPSTAVWYTMDLTNSQTTVLQFGQTGDKPVIGDFDGDGKADYALYRPQTGVWHLLQSAQGSVSIPFGNSTDKPVPADYDGDGKTDVAIYRNGDWWLRRSTFGTVVKQFGVSTDIPAPADYDGDGLADLTVYRDGTWIRIDSKTDVTVYINFGLSGDIPVPSFNIVQ